MSQELITQHVGLHMEAISHATSENSTALQAAGQALAETLLQDGRIIACGNGTANALAQYFCTCLLNRYGQERPALPAINLGADATTFAALCRDNRFNETFSRPLRALAKPGDLLIVLADSGQKSNLIQAIQAGHDKNMWVLALTLETERDIHALIQAGDINIVLPPSSTGTASEVMLVLLNSLCSLVEQTLFGQHD